MESRDPQNQQALALYDSSPQQQQEERKQEEEKKQETVENVDDPERELTEEEKRAIKEAQEAMGSFFSTKKPKNASDGLA